MKFSNFIKMLDNNTDSKVQSRYYNKSLTECKLIIITSSVPINFWYMKLKSQNSVDSLVQLYRRINTYIEITHEVIKIFDDGLDENGHPKGKAEIVVNDLLQSKEKKTDHKKISSVFKEISKLGVWYYEKKVCKRATRVSFWDV